MEWVLLLLLPAIAIYCFYCLLLPLLLLLPAIAFIVSIAAFVASIALYCLLMAVIGLLLFNRRYKRNQKCWRVCKSTAKTTDNYFATPNSPLSAKGNTNAQTSSPSASSWLPSHRRSRSLSWPSAKTMRTSWPSRKSWASPSRAI